MYFPLIWSFRVVGLMFRSLINWVYIGERWGSSCIFYLWRSSSAWCNETLSSSLCFWHLCKDPGGCTCVAYFWVLCSPPVICMCMVLPTPCCFYYRGPVVSPEVKLGIPAAPFGFFLIASHSLCCTSILGLLLFLRRCFWDFGVNSIDSLSHFWV